MNIYMCWECGKRYPSLTEKNNCKCVIGVNTMGFKDEELEKEKEQEEVVKRPKLSSKQIKDMKAFIQVNGGIIKRGASDEEIQTQYESLQVKR
jgi:hypothetical protein